MLAKNKKIPTRTIVMLVVLTALIIGGGYYVYTTFFPGEEEAPVTGGDPAVTEDGSRRSYSIDDDIFSDPTLHELEKRPYKGFVDQYEAIAIDESEPMIPRDVIVSSPPGGGKLIVHWKLPQHINFDLLRVYRSFAAGKLGEPVYEVSTENLLGGEQMNFLDVNVENGDEYYYLVRTVTTDTAEGEIESSNGIQTSGIPFDEIPPDPPLNVAVLSLDDSHIKISWINPPDSDFRNMKIYRSIRKGKLGVVIYPNEKTNIGRDVTAYIDTVASNAEYYYTVSSVDTSGNESSTDVLAIPQKENPFIPSF